MNALTSPYARRDPLSRLSSFANHIAAVRPELSRAARMLARTRAHLLASLVVLVFASSAHGASPSSQESDIYDALFGWAVKLSGYPTPAVAPTVRFVPQQFFDDNACRHRHCQVWGWYPNTGQNVVYVHEAVRALIADGSEESSIFAASIIVHEFTHYLQAASRSFAPYRCEEALQLEREAYAVQSAYIVDYGRYFQVGISMHTARCEGSAHEATLDDVAHGDDAPAR